MNHARRLAASTFFNSLLGLSAGFAASPHALAVEIDPVGLVDQAAEDGVGVGGCRLYRRCGRPIQMLVLATMERERSDIIDRFKKASMLRAELRRPISRSLTYLSEARARRGASVLPAGRPSPRNRRHASVAE